MSELEERVNELEQKVEGLTKAIRAAASMEVIIKGTLRQINRSGTGNDLVVDGLKVHRVLEAEGLS